MTMEELQWGQIPLEPKKLYVRLLLNDGYTREAIGAFFGTTKNAIVGFQHKHLPELTGQKVGTKEGVTLERLEILMKPRTPTPVRPALRLVDEDDLAGQVEEIRAEYDLRPGQRLITALPLSEQQKIRRHARAFLHWRVTQ